MTKTFFALGTHTSHMTGILSSAADDLALGAIDAALDCAGALLAFLAGAACCAIMVNFARRRNLHSEFALPLLLEAMLLLAFGVLGTQLQAIDVIVLPATVMLLCFMMGLQNAVITKLSNAEIRTTHMTGIITDLGIEAGKAAYWNRDDQAVPRVTADWKRMRILLALVSSFFAGAVAGAFGFKFIGFGATLPLAAVLTALAIVPIIDDLRARPHLPPQHPY